MFCYKLYIKKIRNIKRLKANSEKAQGKPTGLGVIGFLKLIITTKYKKKYASKVSGRVTVNIKKTKRKVEVKTNQKNIYDKRNAFTLQQKEAIFVGF